ncbi:MAG: hypothetical protein NT001_00665 [Candidatus Woesearchaeota archaeon]|nr:hypothetical protein [Candidatus Woesearchaeota archaeon]
MKNQYVYALLLICVLLIAGCGKISEPVSAGAQQTAPSAAQTPAATSQPVSLELTSAESAKALSRLDLASKSVISTPSMVMKIGDNYVFGIGIVNVMPKSNNFKVVLHFKEAKSNGLATLLEGVDDNTMLDWIGKSRLSIITLDSQEKKVIPLVVEVLPQMGPGKKTEPGSYVFDVDTQYETSMGSWETYALNTLTVRVG